MIVFSHNVTAEELRAGRATLPAGTCAVLRVGTIAGDVVIAYEVLDEAHTLGRAPRSQPDEVTVVLLWDGDVIPLNFTHVDSFTVDTELRHAYALPAEALQGELPPSHRTVW